MTSMETMQHYQLARLALPSLHPSFSRKQQTVLRLIQSKSLPHPTKPCVMLPERYTAEEKFKKRRRNRISLHHNGGCDFSSEKSTPSFREQWEMLMSSFSLGTQLALVYGAQAAMTSRVVPVNKKPLPTSHTTYFRRLRNVFPRSLPPHCSSLRHYLVGR